MENGQFGVKWEEFLKSGVVQDDGRINDALYDCR